MFRDHDDLGLAGRDLRTGQVGEGDIVRVIMVVRIGGVGPVDEVAVGRARPFPGNQGQADDGGQGGETAGPDAAVQPVQDDHQAEGRQEVQEGQGAQAAYRVGTAFHRQEAGNQHNDEPDQGHGVGGPGRDRVRVGVGRAAGPGAPEADDETQAGQDRQEGVEDRPGGDVEAPVVIALEAEHAQDFDHVVAHRAPGIAARQVRVERPGLVGAHEDVFGVLGIEHEQRRGDDRRGHKHDGQPTEPRSHKAPVAHGQPGQPEDEGGGHQAAGVVGVGGQAERRPGQGIPAPLLRPEGGPERPQGGDFAHGQGDDAEAVAAVDQVPRRRRHQPRREQRHPPPLPPPCPTEGGTGKQEGQQHGQAAVDRAGEVDGATGAPHKAHHAGDGVEHQRLHAGEGGIEDWPLLADVGFPGQQGVLSLVIVEAGRQAVNAVEAQGDADQDDDGEQGPVETPDPLAGGRVGGRASVGGELRRGHRLP